jgi:quinol monooxygenase YgiN
MHARVTFATVQSDKVDEVTRVVRYSIMPATKKLKGFKGYLFLSDRKTGKCIAITQWDTEANMISVEDSGKYKESIAKVETLFAGAPTMEHYEIGVKV